jgi:hypothetical protein
MRQMRGVQGGWVVGEAERASWLPSDLVGFASALTKGVGKIGR